MKLERIGADLPEIRTKLAGIAVRAAVNDFLRQVFGTAWEDRNLKARLCLPEEGLALNILAFYAL